MTVEYAAEKLLSMVYTLATGTRPLPERLRTAYLEDGVYTPDVDGDVDDPEIRPDIKMMHALMRRRSADGGEGTLEATFNRMSEAEAVDLAERVVQLAHRVCDVQMRQRYRGP